MKTRYFVLLTPVARITHSPFGVKSLLNCNDQFVHNYFSIYYPDMSDLRVLDRSGATGNLLEKLPVPRSDADPKVLPMSAEEMRQQAGTGYRSKHE